MLQQKVVWCQFDHRAHNTVSKLYGLTMQVRDATAKSGVVSV